MNARNRVFLILGILTVGSLIWYFATTRRTSDLQLTGTVDANEVIVSSKIPGRIQTLTVEEGQDVTQGELIAVIESQDLQDQLKAAEARMRQAEVDYLRAKIDYGREQAVADGNGGISDRFGDRDASVGRRLTRRRPLPWRRPRARPWRNGSRR